MDALVNLFLAFLEGLGIILSPCILPVLPILFATGIVGGKNKPYGIMLGFIIAFCLFTLFARAIVLATGVNLDSIRTLSFIILILLSIVMMSTYLSDLFSRLTQRLSSFGASFSAKQSQKSGFLNGILIGLPVGLIWTPCAGPIIAAVIVQTIRAKTNLETMLTLLFFSLGVVIPILLIIIFGKKLLNRHTFLTTHAQSIRKVLGATLFLAVILNMQGVFNLPVDEIPATHQELNSEQLINPITSPYSAPEIKDISHWINSPPLTLAQLKGKVILIDFWTYSCINCIRTLPYLKAWDAKYHDKGLVIIGIHSPEFAFEQKMENVAAAVKKLGILYPVALDNQLETWTNFQNHYWPAHYLINKQGEVVYTHFGEGQYDVTEHNIQILLGEKPNPQPVKSTQREQLKPLSYFATTPETYLGSDRAANFAGEYPKFLKLNEWAIKGNWKIEPQKIISLSKGSALELHFKAQKVFLVLGSSNQEIKKINVLLNGKPVGSLGGSDVKNSLLLIKDHTLYELINLPENTEGILELIFDEPGVEAYAFTFG